MNAFDRMQQTKAATGSRQRMEDGDYNVVITKAWTQSVKNGGTMLWLQYVVAEGENFAGTEFKESFNIVNKSDQAVDIAFGQLKAIFICSDTSLDEIADLPIAEIGEPLVGQMLRMRVITEVEHNVPIKQDDGSTRKVTVRRYRPVVYMNTEGQDAEGKEVPEFVAVVKKEVDNSGSSDTTNQSSGSTGSSSSSSSIDLDDEIPFD